MSPDPVMAWLIPGVVVLVRTGSVVQWVPFFANTGWMSPAKALFSLLLTLLLVPVLPVGTWPIPATAGGLTALLAGEALVGLGMGLVIMIFLFALELVGDMLGYQMAFSMARAVDPGHGSQTNVLSAFLGLVGAIYFLMIGGDHMVLRTLGNSFTWLPPGQLWVRQEVWEGLRNLINHAFVMGIRLALPGVAAMLLLDITLGILGKTTPKVQIFFLGLPMKVGIGLVLFAALVGTVLTLWGGALQQELGQWMQQILSFLRR